MMETKTVKQAAKSLGYRNPESFKRRIRTLRVRGQVNDIGSPPIEYRDESAGPTAGVTLFWYHPKYYVIWGELDRKLFPGEKKEKKEKNEK